MGTVTGNDTNLPIEGAMVNAKSISMGDIFTYTTDISGTYSASLCPDFYELTAEATGYIPGEADTAVYSGTQTIQDFSLMPISYPPLEVSLAGQAEGWINTSYTFTATVEPISTTLPLTYTWQVDEQVPIVHTNGLTDTVDLTWDTPGTKVITVTAGNLAGSVMDTHTISITNPLYEIYLPLVSKAVQPPLSPDITPLGGGVFLGLVTLGVMGWWRKRLYR